MAVSKKVAKPSVKEDKIEELILKGGSSGKEIAHEEQGIIKKVQLRISTNTLKRIDGLAKKRAGNVSRHTWIMEAIAEKLGIDET